MWAELRTVSCGVLLAGNCLCFSVASQADEPVVQKFGDWSVTIQAGPRGLAPREERQPSAIKLVSHQEASGSDDASIPPAPNGKAAHEAEPSTAGNAHPAEVAPELRPSLDALTMVRLYSQVYDSIPFSRAEYEANPSYRHDATMEFLFGQMRPTVIQRGTTRLNVRLPMMPAPWPVPYSPYGFNSYNFPFYQGSSQPYSLW